MNGMRKTDDHHNTAEQVTGYLRDALAIAAGEELTPGERETVLPVLVNLLASKQVFYEQVAMGGGLDLTKLRGRH